MASNVHNIIIIIILIIIIIIIIFFKRRDRLRDGPLPVPVMNPASLEAPEKPSGTGERPPPLRPHGGGAPQAGRPASLGLGLQRIPGRERPAVERRRATGAPSPPHLEAEFDGKGVGPTQFQQSLVACTSPSPPLPPISRRPRSVSEPPLTPQAGRRHRAGRRPPPAAGRPEALTEDDAGRGRLRATARAARKAPRGTWPRGREESHVWHTRPRGHVDARPARVASRKVATDSPGRAHARFPGGALMKATGFLRRTLEQRRRRRRREPPSPPPQRKDPCPPLKSAPRQRRQGGRRPGASGEGGGGPSDGRPAAPTPPSEYVEEEAP